MKNLFISALLYSALFVNVFGFSQDTKESIMLDIKNEYKREYPEIKISNIEIENISNDTQNGLRYRFLELQKQNLKKNFGVAAALFFTEKNTTKRVFIRYKIEAQLPIVKAKYNLQKDKIITEEDIVVEEAELKSFYSKPLTPKEVIGLATSRFISAKTTLYQKDAKRPPLIRKNSIAYASINEDGVAIEFEVIALEDGNVGDIINVKTKSGKMMKALIDKDGKMELK